MLKPTAPGRYPGQSSGSSLPTIGATDHASLEEILGQALHTVRMHLKMEFAFISEFQGGVRIFRYVDGQDGPLPLCVGASDPLEESYCQRIVDGRLPELIPNAGRLAEALTLPVTLSFPVGAHLSVPIRFSDGRLYGTFCCFSTKPNDNLNEHNLATLRLFVAFAGHLLERHVMSRKAHEVKTARITSVIAEQAFRIVYQPIIHVVQSRVVGYEALARFTTEPLRSPDRWLDDAAQVGLQQQLEIALIKEALKGLDHFPVDCYVSLNVSPETILSGAVANTLANFPLKRIMLEVTEHELVTDYALIARTLEPLRQQGLLLAVDDAGAGYASFRHILKLKPDVIKLDSSLIHNIDSNNDCRALAAALIRFGEETGSRIVAEGVETEGELAMLRQLKVNKAQGYLLGIPAPLEDYRFT